MADVARGATISNPECTMDRPTRRPHFVTATLVRLANEAAVG
jgi:hypothetical protein